MRVFVFVFVFVSPVLVPVFGYWLLDGLDISFDFYFFGYLIQFLFSVFFVCIVVPGFYDICKKVRSWPSRLWNLCGFFFLILIIVSSPFSAPSPSSSRLRS